MISRLLCIPLAVLIAAGGTLYWLRRRAPDGVNTAALNGASFMDLRTAIQMQTGGETHRLSTEHKRREATTGSFESIAS